VWIVDGWGFAALFHLSTGIALAALILTVSQRETLTRVVAAPFSLASLLSRGALFPSFVIFCFMTTYGALVAFLAIYAQSRGTNPGIFFLVMAVVIALARGYAGIISDRVGRAPVAAAGQATAAAALVVLAVDDGFAALAAAGALYGLGLGTTQPSLTAWAVDLVGQRSGARPWAPSTPPSSSASPPAPWDSVPCSRDELSRHVPGRRHHVIAGGHLCGKPMGTWNTLTQRRRPAMKKKIGSPHVPDPPPQTWSNCLVVGNQVFVAGMVARGSEGAVGGDSMYAQAQAIFAKIKHLVEAAGGTMNDIVKVVIFVTDIKRREEVWKARREVFTGDFPRLDAGGGAGVGGAGVPRGDRGDRDPGGGEALGIARAGLPAHHRPLTLPSPPVGERVIGWGQLT
jgi:enamine deaminase RidA (YjgF/YER057c/UK114 family)